RANLSHMGTAAEVSAWIDNAVAGDRLNYWFGNKDKAWLQEIQKGLKSDPDAYRLSLLKITERMNQHAKALGSAYHTRYHTSLHEVLARTASGEDAPGSRKAGGSPGGRMPLRPLESHEGQPAEGEAPKTYDHNWDGRMRSFINTLKTRGAIDDTMVERINKARAASDDPRPRELVTSALHKMRAGNVKGSQEDVVKQVLKPAVELAETYVRLRDNGAPPEVLKYLGEPVSGTRRTKGSIEGDVDKLWQAVGNNEKLSAEDKTQLWSTIVKHGSRDALEKLVPKLDADGLRNLHEVLYKSAQEISPEFGTNLRVLCERLGRELYPRSVLPIALENLTAGLNQAQREAMLDAMAKRKDFLSEEGMKKHLRSLGEELKEAGATRRRHVVDEIFLVVNSPEGEAMAQMFRKATGLEVSIHRLNEGGSPPTKGKAVLFLDGKNQAAVDKAKTIYGDNLVTSGKVQALFEGATMHDLHLATQLPTAENILRLRERLGLRTDKDYDPGAPAPKLTRGEYDTFMKVFEKDVELARLRGIAEALISPLKSSSESKATEGLAALMATAAGVRHYDTRRAISFAATLHKKLFGDAKTIPDDTLFVSFSSKQKTRVDSLEHSSYLYRLANGMTDSKYDGKFLSESQFLDRLSKGELNGVKRIVIVDDMATTGKQVIDRSTRLHEACKSQGRSDMGVVFSTFVASHDAQVNIGKQLRATGGKVEFLPVRVVNKPFDRAGSEASEKAVYPNGWGTNSVHRERVEQVLKGISALNEQQRKAILESFSKPHEFPFRVETGADRPKEIDLISPVMLFMVHNSVPKLFAEVLKIFDASLARTQIQYKTRAERTTPKPEGVPVKKSRYEGQKPREFEGFNLKNYGDVDGAPIIRAGALTQKELTPATATKLKEQGVKLIVDLRYHHDELKGVEKEKTWAQENGLKHVTWTDICKGSDLRPPLNVGDVSQAHLKLAADYLQQQRAVLGEGGKMYVHCRHGRDRAGAVVRAFEVLHGGVTPQKADENMKKFGGKPNQWKFP
ncbi:MAG: tyrosine-protein phosphatase, partial [Candidatus Obscuribacterales bacterium]|nr:tyrosine-protein phosphatase [Candidatus Obscuribacterales bacterium]